VRNDDTGDRLLKETLKGWRRDRLSELPGARALAQLKDESDPADTADTSDTRVDTHPSPLPEDDIPELPSALLDFAEEESEDHGHDHSADHGDALPPRVPLPVSLAAPTVMLSPPPLETSSEPRKNLLRIKAGSFSLELEGDADFINNVYDSVRDDLLAKMAAASRAAPGAEPPSGDSGLNIDVEKLPDIKVKGNGYVWVYVCHELYNKVHVVSRDTLAVSPLASFVDTRRMNKVYVNRARLKELESLIGSGKTLWSELTTEGRRRLRRGGL